MAARKILIIDDEPDTLMLVESRLRANGYLVMTAADGETGFEIAKRELPQLILADYMLPKMDGLKLCALLKKDSQCSAIPVIVFTAKAQEVDMKSAIEAGADAYLTKPFTPQTLLETIQGVIQRPEGSAGAGGVVGPETD